MFLSSRCVTSCLPPHILISLAWSWPCRSELATDWTVDKNNFPYSRCGHHHVSTLCLHPQKVRKWCDDSSRGHSDPTGCMHSYLRRSEIVVEEVLTRLWHVLSQMRHLHARRTGRVYLYPCLCLSRFYRRGRLLKKHFNISERTRFGKRKTLTNTVQKIAGGIQCQFSLLLSIWCRPSELCSSANFNGLYSVLHVRHQASTLCVKKEMQRNWACRTNSLWSEHLFWRRTGLSGKTASGFSSVCVCVCSVSQWQTNRQNNRNICESSTRANRQRQER